MTGHNPYAPPTARVEDVESRYGRHTARATPPSVSRHIRNGAFAALVWGLVVGVLSVVAIVTLPGHRGELPRSFVDVALVLGLAFGVYSRSRVCAVLLLLYLLTVIPTVIAGQARVVFLPFLAVTMFLVAKAAVAAFASRKTS